MLLWNLSLLVWTFKLVFKGLVLALDLLDPPDLSEILSTEYLCFCFLIGLATAISERGTLKSTWTCFSQLLTIGTSLISKFKSFNSFDCSLELSLLLPYSASNKPLICNRFFLNFCKVVSLIFRSPCKFSVCLINSYLNNHTSSGLHWVCWVQWLFALLYLLTLLVAA